MEQGPENLNIQQENIQKLTRMQGLADAYGFNLKLSGLPEDTQGTEEAQKATERLGEILKNFSEAHRKAQLEINELTNVIFGREN